MDEYTNRHELIGHIEYALSCISDIREDNCQQSTVRALFTRIFVKPEYCESWIVKNKNHNKKYHWDPIDYEETANQKKEEDISDEQIQNEFNEYWNVNGYSIVLKHWIAKYKDHIDPSFIESNAREENLNAIQLVEDTQYIINEISYGNSISDSELIKTKNISKQKLYDLENSLHNLDIVENSHDTTVDNIEARSRNEENITRSSCGTKFDVHIETGNVNNKNNNEDIGGNENPKSFDNTKNARINLGNEKNTDTTIDEIVKNNVNLKNRNNTDTKYKRNSNTEYLGNRKGISNLVNENNTNLENKRNSNTENLRSDTKTSTNNVAIANTNIEKHQNSVENISFENISKLEDDNEGIENNSNWDLLWNNYSIEIYNQYFETFKEKYFGFKEGVVDDCTAGFNEGVVDDCTAGLDYMKQVQKDIKYNRSKGNRKNKPKEAKHRNIDFLESNEHLKINNKKQFSLGHFIETSLKDFVDESIATDEEIGMENVDKQKMSANLKESVKDMSNINCEDEIKLESNICELAESMESEIGDRLVVDRNNKRKYKNSSNDDKSKKKLIRNGADENHSSLEKDKQNESQEGEDVMSRATINDEILTDQQEVANNNEDDDNIASSILLKFNKNLSKPNYFLNKLGLHFNDSNNKNKKLKEKKIKLFVSRKKFRNLNEKLKIDTMDEGDDLEDEDLDLEERDDFQEKGNKTTVNKHIYFNFSDDSEDGKERKIDNEDKIEKTIESIEENIDSSHELTEKEEILEEFEKEVLERKCPINENNTFDDIFTDLDKVNDENLRDSKKENLLGDSYDDEGPEEIKIEKYTNKNDDILNDRYNTLNKSNTVCVDNIGTNLKSEVNNEFEQSSDHVIDRSEDISEFIEDPYDSKSRKLSNVLGDDLVNIENISVSKKLSRNKGKKSVGKTNKIEKDRFNFDLGDNVPIEVLANSYLKKYYLQRYLYWSRYDEGIAMDEESWYSVTPEKVAQHIASRCSSTDIVIDAFCGCGGNTIQFAMVCQKVISIDIDPKKIQLAKHNASVYGVCDRIQFIVGDFFQVGPQLKADVIFLSPPWGGPEYCRSSFSIENVFPLYGGGRALFNMAKQITNNIGYYLPRTTNTFELIELAGVGNTCEIEQNFLGRKFVALTAYYGSLMREADQLARKSH